MQRWGQARLTRNVDLTLLTGFGGEASFVEALLGAYSPRHKDSAQFALRSRVRLLNSPEEPRLIFLLVPRLSNI